MTETIIDGKIKSAVTLIREAELLLEQVAGEAQIRVAELCDAQRATLHDVAIEIEAMEAK